MGVISPSGTDPPVAVAHVWVTALNVGEDEVHCCSAKTTIYPWNDGQVEPIRSATSMIIDWLWVMGKFSSNELQNADAVVPIVG
jgi:hypothetical protein